MKTIQIPKQLMSERWQRVIPTVYSDDNNDAGHSDFEGEMTRLQFEIEEIVIGIRKWREQSAFLNVEETVDF